MDAKFIEIKDLVEEQITRGSESSEKILGEDHHFVLHWRGHNLSPRGTGLDIRGKKASKPMRLELLGRNGGSPPIGGDRSLRRGSFGGGGGRSGDVNRPAGRGCLGLGSCLGALGGHGDRAECAARGKEMCGKKKRKFGGEGASEGFWTLPLAIYTGVKTLESYSG